MIDLYRLSNKNWVVKPTGSEIEMFLSIELAAEHMEKLGVHSDEVDAALMDLFSKDHIHANFSAEGKYTYTDSARPDELLGIA